MFRWSGRKLNAGRAEWQTYLALTDRNQTGGRSQVRQRKRWEDNIREWRGLEFGKSRRAVENREKWRKLVAKSSVVPQRPSRLRDWWWWWWTKPDPSYSLGISCLPTTQLVRGLNCPELIYCHSVPVPRSSSPPPSSSSSSSSLSTIILFVW